MGADRQCHLMTGTGLTASRASQVDSPTAQTMRNKVKWFCNKQERLTNFSLSSISLLELAQPPVLSCLLSPNLLLLLLFSSLLLRRSSAVSLVAMALTLQFLTTLKTTRRPSLVCMPYERNIAVNLWHRRRVVCVFMYFWFITIGAREHFKKFFVCVSVAEYAARCSSSQQWVWGSLH
jgi:hypothetical protein